MCPAITQLHPTLVMVEPRWQCAPTSSRLGSALIWSRNHCGQQAGGKGITAQTVGSKQLRGHITQKVRAGLAQQPLQARKQAGPTARARRCATTPPATCGCRCILARRLSANAPGTPSPAHLQVRVADAELGARQAGGHVRVHLAHAREGGRGGSAGSRVGGRGGVMGTEGEWVMGRGGVGRSSALAQQCRVDGDPANMRQRLSNRDASSDAHPPGDPHRG